MSTRPKQKSLTAHPSVNFRHPTLNFQHPAIRATAESRRIRLDRLIADLKGSSELECDLVEDTLRMYASMGKAKVWSDAGGLWFGAVQMERDSFSRKDYLATFSDELLAKSRRIDYLIRHTGTVGTYREELLRSTIRQLLPTRYQVSTGFLENSPRQLDVLVWDAERYAPLFREQDVVVVPSEAVRAIVEVKTTLNTSALDEALDILYEVMRVEQPAIPVFKGIFAFESEYKSDVAIAERIRTFHNSLQADGHISRQHRYLMQGITAVCVPHHNYVFQRYVLMEDENTFPQPQLFSLQPEWPGDVRTAAFLSQLLSHLDIEPGPKRSQGRSFAPIFQECRTELLKALFGEN
jgi:hypothetical protein